MGLDPIQHGYAFSNLNLGGMMSEMDLPTDWEELGNLIASGEMSEDLITRVIEEHGHTAFDCKEVCVNVWENFDLRPLDLLIQNYAEDFTTTQRKKLYETYEQHILPEERAARSWMLREKINIAVGGSSDQALLQKAAEDFYWFIYEYEDSELENLAEEEKEFAFKFASHHECNVDILNTLVKNIHEGVSMPRDNGLCSDGTFEACDFCQDLLQEAVGKLK
jgi:hypothetical protein